MTDPRWIRGYRLLFGLLALATIAFQCWYSATVRGFPLSNFFSFFTIQSNVFAAAVLLWGSSRTVPTQWSATNDLIRGAATLYLSMTGIVYGVLLSGYQEALQTTIPWVDTVLHRVIPLVMVVDWLIDPPNRAISFQQGVRWLIYPLLYVIYTLLRGPLVDWYPYPFLDPRIGGYERVALYCLGITLMTVLFVWLVVAMGRRFQLVGRAT